MRRTLILGLTGTFLVFSLASAQNTNPALAIASAPSPAAKPETQLTLVASVPQRWQNRVEFACRSPTETADQYQKRLNDRTMQVGLIGWELISITPIGLVGAIKGADCLVIAFKKPEAR